MLEQAIEANTKAIHELIAAIKAGVPTTAAQVEAVATEAKAEAKPKAEEKKPEAPAAASAAPAPTQPTAAATAAPEKKAENSANAPALKYDDVAKAVLTVSAKKGREAAITLLQGFGLETLKAAKPDQFAAIKAAAEAAL